MALRGMFTTLPITLPKTMRMACQWLNPTWIKASVVSLRNR